MACQPCGKVKQEQLAFVADNPLYTKRFALYVGRRCRASTIQDVAQDLRLDWHTVKALEQQYMREQLRRAGTPGPRVIGLDEISLRRGHTYRIVVTDLIRARAIWFGGTDRSEASMDAFFTWLGPRKSKQIRVAVMDMWKAFRASTRHHAPQASILFDKFHILRHLGVALDLVRKSEYARLSGKDRRFVKGQKYTLLAHRENLSMNGRRTLKTLLAANKRLNTAYLLKESFGQLWSYDREGWARELRSRQPSKARSLSERVLRAHVLFNKIHDYTKAHCAGLKYLAAPPTQKTRMWQDRERWFWRVVSCLPTAQKGKAGLAANCGGGVPDPRPQRRLDGHGGYVAAIRCLRPTLTTPRPLI